jgi:uncharacterized protein (TIGR02679 family)
MEDVSDATRAPNIERAATFFQQAAFERLLLALRQKYIEQGQAGGLVTLRETSLAERRELASFLGRPVYRTDTIRIKLSEMDAALRQSSFQCSLFDLISAVFPDQPLITRLQQRQARVDHQEHFHQQLQDLCSARPEESRSRQWLLQGLHGLEWLFARYKNADQEEQQRQLAVVHIVLTALDRLPEPEMPQRLAIFAQNISGDPHCLDPAQPAGRLFLLALSDLAHEALDPASQGRAMELQLYQQVNLLVDTISSSVAVFNLAAAHSLDGSVDPLLRAAGARILLLPLSQVLHWQRVTPTTSDIYVIENPQVFEEVVARLQDDVKNVPGLEIGSLPTIICTSGWPSIAALKLLELLMLDHSHNHLHYSGDFDVKGLQIAAYLQDFCVGHYDLWRMDAEAYTMALQMGGGVQVQDSDLQLLQSLPADFEQISQQMQIIKQWAYQEGIVQLLLADVRHAM